MKPVAEYLIRANIEGSRLEVVAEDHTGERITTRFRSRRAAEDAGYAIVSMLRDLARRVEDGQLAAVHVQVSVVTPLLSMEQLATKLAGVKA